jgi:hypothetical protein
MSTKGNFELLMEDIEKAVEEANSPYGGGWWVTNSGKLVCETLTSRDPSRSSTGGEYFFYRDFISDGLGVQAKDAWSAEWDIRDYGGEAEEYYDCLITPAGLERMARLAEVTLAARAWINKEKGSMRLLKKAVRALED